MSEVAEKLRAIALEIREHPERWTQGCFAKDEDGHEIEDYEEGPDCDGEDPCEYRESAVCWCAVGFLYRDQIIGYDGDPSRDEAFKLLMRAAGFDAKEGPFALNWNDAPGRTAAEVADAFERAAALAESAQ